MSITTETSALIERLLFEEESDALDFKRTQYRFEGASDADKAELLKDILAFANSWRRADAYILLGVEEVKGGRSLVVGVDRHLDDAQLQQFVNSKTQRPIRFSYSALEFEGSQLAVICIPLQQRPVYLRTAYASLQANEVVVRRGSSTAVATPDEIAQMGRPLDAAERPELELHFIDPGSRSRVEPQVHSVALEIPAKSDIPTYRLPSNGPFGGHSLELIPQTGERG